ncbi:MAG TPA: nuclear transport factor 2 family protein [Aridibacter sp.]|nr:nuclear transport factor 2 family protein [Aridibacter sp.]
MKAGWDAWSKSDAKWFEGHTTDKYVAITGDEGRSDRAARINYQAEHKCEIESLSHSDQRTTKFSDDVVLVTYKASVDGTCDGNAVPKTIWAGTIFVKEGEDWKLAFHMGTPVS